ncbi:MAG TPA: tRNA (N(6)-L-threonylcarbamoyladenosine(37)-C(2))-methylthiotransferase MtaB [Firmicutes bacterium]|nr:tRNA (N(6)-L-threonylcarbamoyladenosine(37)-C(2))-methylthiotransferase MtaB [Bacillota bacterium]
MIVYFHTLGCKVNQYETQAMRALMEAEGCETSEALFSGTPEERAAMQDAAIVLNSCTVTGESDRKLRQLLRRCRREYPHAVLVLTGCFPQAFPEAAERFSEADIVLGNACRRALPRYLHDFLARRQRIVDIAPHSREFESLAVDDFGGRTRAFVKIEDGCDRFCAYCIIPYARGRVRSKPLPELERELAALSAKGYAEAVLSGINLTAYGRDLGLGLCDAVEAACRTPGIRRVRLGSLEPDMLTPAVIARLGAQEKLCPQFHLSLQSGCAATLKRMNRHYTPEEYLAVCGALRERFPGCALTTDVMVGFPGEDEAEFAESLAFVKKVGFARAHVFAYSRRPGTVAARMDGQVPREEKSHRSRRMIAACDQLRDAFLDAWVGREAEVLLETRSKDGRWEGYTPAYIPVLVPAGEGLRPGGAVRVRITGRREGVCEGELA